MNNSHFSIALVLGIVVVGAGIWYYTSLPAAPAPVTTNSTATTTTESTGGANNANNSGGVSVEVGVNTAPLSATVTYTASGYSPKDVRIASGGTITFVSQVGPMWTAADEHPTHTEYDGTSRATHCDAAFSGPAAFDQCGQGTSYSYTFGKVGTWEYHNHMASQHGGTVTVVAQ